MAPTILLLQHLNKTQQDNSVNVVKMAEEGFELRAEDNDLPTSSLACLHLRDEAVVINEGTNHMVDNPEPQSVFAVMMSSALNQSREQMDIPMATRPEPSPAVQGKIFKHQYWYFNDKTNSDAFDHYNKQLKMIAETISQICWLCVTSSFFVQNIFKPNYGLVFIQVECCK